MTVTIYVEGGAQNSAQIIRCKRGFAEYCNKLAPAGRRPTIVPCGSRARAFDHFKTDIERNKPDSMCALLVDSEGAVLPGVDAEAHLHGLEGWRFLSPPSGRVFLMVQAMEAWFFADRATLAEYYGDGFRPNALRGSERNVEVIAKDDLEPSLVGASRDTKTKGAYKKATHAFDLLALIDPSKVEAASAHAAKFHYFLRSL